MLRIGEGSNSNTMLDDMKAKRDGSELEHGEDVSSQG
jgi:hypothetical protein